MEVLTTSDVPKRGLVGILGGMGPAATIDFMAKIINATPASSDQEHVPMIVHSVPQIPDRTTCIARGSDAPFLPMLAGLRLLRSSGADLVAIPCNTAHYWYDRLVRSCDVRIIHIADAVMASLVQSASAGRRIALLATRGTVKTEVYGRRLMDAGLDLVLPEEPVQELIDCTIKSVKCGGLAIAARTADEAARQLFDAWRVDRLLLACTELPIAFARTRFMDASIDATDALAHACVRESLALR